MSSYLLINTSYVVFFIIALTYLFYLFFLINKYLSVKSSKKLDIPSRIDSQFDINITFFRFLFILIIFLASTMLAYKAFSIYFFYNNLYISTFTIYICLVIIIVLFFLVLLVYFNMFSSLEMNIDYLFSMSMLLLLSPFIYSSPNVFSMFFVLELLSCLILYNFTTSRTYTNNTFITNPSIIVSNRSSKEHVRTIFTQFWISFFSSALIILFLILSLFTWGTSSFIDLDIFLSYISTNGTSYYFWGHNFKYIVWSLLFLLGFFLKSGLVPFHMYKVEVYKGLSLLSILFYTFIFFLTFFTYLSVLGCNLLNQVFCVSFNIASILLLFMSPIILHSSLNVKQVKTFFAYSGIINSFLLAIPLFTLI